ncbi:MAG: D-alanyl-D-alanine carboxypeptidase/D-alanyl-D-alanine endopeptidase [Acidimicrobiales bacterium]
MRGLRWTGVAVGSLAAVVAFPGSSPASPAPTTPAPTTPAPTKPAPTTGASRPPLLATALLSPSRLPRTLQELWARRSLVPALDRATSAAALGQAGAQDSCVVVAQGGQVLFEDHPDLPVLPASNMKLVTATALLDKLGPGYRFTTSVVARHRPVGGVVQGDIWFVGGGDPLLRLPAYAAGIPGGDQVWTDVQKIVTSLKATGLRRVTGSVLGDDTRYDSQRTVASWPARYAEEVDVGQLSALGIDDGFALAGPPVPVSAPPPVQSAGVLTDRLRSAGVKVGGPPGSGRAPAGGRALARLVSPPLSRILGEVLRESDNTAMELLTKELGLDERGTGSTAAGVAAVRADLAADGLPVAGLVNVDGSGLSRSDRVTCNLLVAVLRRAGADGLLVHDLPVAAESGTLAGQLGQTVAAGRVLAKTGTLDGVKALSGWVEPARGQVPGNPALAAPVVFSAVLNGLATSVVDPDRLTDRVALDLAEYPRAPALARFEPAEAGGAGAQAQGIGAAAAGAEGAGAA